MDSPNPTGSLFPLWYDKSLSDSAPQLLTITQTQNTLTLLLSTLFLYLSFVSASVSLQMALSSVVGQGSPFRETIEAHWVSYCGFGTY